MSTKPPSPKAPAQEKPTSAVTQQIIERFPEFATMLGIPEIADLLERGAQENWSPAYFQQQLWHSKWWKNTPESSRAWQARKLIDPATAGAQSKTMAANVIGTANTLGLHLTPAEVAWYTEFAQGEGWDQAALTRNLIDTHKRKQYQAGTIKNTQDSLHALAGNYGVSISPQNAFHWASQIAAGRQTQEGFEAWTRNQAKAAFPTLAKEIDAGLTVRQVADPYLQIAAQTLGINPAKMMLTDPKWQRALQGRDAKGEPTGPMNTLDWSRTIKTDPAYGYDHSANGQLAAYQLRDEIEKRFGVRT